MSIYICYSTLNVEIANTEKYIPFYNNVNDKFKCFNFVNSRLIENSAKPRAKLLPSFVGSVRVSLQKPNYLFLLVKSDPSAGRALPSQCCHRCER